MQRVLHEAGAAWIAQYKKESGMFVSSDTEKEPVHTITKIRPFGRFHEIKPKILHTVGNRVQNRNRVGQGRAYDIDVIQKKIWVHVYGGTGGRERGIMAVYANRIEHHDFPGLANHAFRFIIPEEWDLDGVNDRYYSCVERKWSKQMGVHWIYKTKFKVYGIDITGDKNKSLGTQDIVLYKFNQ
jgi:hypothetical protein